MNSTIFLLISFTILLLVLTSLLFKKFLKLKKQNQSLKNKYGAIIDLDAYKDSLLKEKVLVEGEITSLKNQYREKREIFDRIVKEAAIYDEEIAIAEWGFYKPHFDYDTSEKFKHAIEENRKKQKIQLDKELEALKAKGFSKSDIRLPDYAFNRACDSAISNVRWNNALKMEQRIIKAFEFINKNADGVFITQEVLDLKLEELRLTHEYEMKKKAEKEEQAEIRQRMREDSKLEEDLRKAESEEEKYQKLLDKAKKEALKAVGDKEKELESKIAMLTEELNFAHAKTERAKSLAEQTKRGHIYVISNIGSFGENVYKIGMTRRLDPQERIDELGDASVPFRFDVHAIIYTEDAPALEKALHRELAKHQVNLVNYRKEFFKIELNRIQELVKQNHPYVEFVITAEAKEYHESLAIRATTEKKEMEGDVRMKYPIAI